jgi:cytoskeletal protein RodZ
MKQCPVCKTTYTDESLRFCLADGAALFSLSETEEPTHISPKRNPLQVNIPQNAATQKLPPTQAAQNQPKNRSVLPFIIAAILSLMLLGIIGVAALIVINPFGGTEKSVVSNDSNVSNSSIRSNNQKTSAANSSRSPENQTNELEEKLADLQKQLEDQKNQKKTSNTPPFPATPEQNNPATPTARVAQSNDGFLSLRTEPSVKTGTQLVKIPSGATVELHDCQREYQTIDGRRGRWCMISFEGEMGWAFDAWLIY